MKTKNIGKIVSALVVGLSYGSFVQAQNDITITRDNGKVYNVSVSDNDPYKIEKHGNNYMLMRQLANNDNAETYTVSCHAVCPKGGAPSKAIIYNKDFTTYQYYDGAKTTELTKVPAGKYDIAVEFEYGPLYQLYYVFQEDVTVDGNIIVDFDMNEAKNGISYKYYDETGKELHMEEYDIDYNLTREPTAMDMIKSTTFAHKEYGASLIKILNFGGVITDYEEDFFVNDLSDKYCIIQGAQVVANKTVYNYSNIVTDFKTQTVANDPNNLRKVRTKFHYSDYMLDDEDAHVMGSRVNLYFNGLRELSSSVGTTDPVVDGETTIWIDMNHAEEGADFDFTAATLPMSSDSYTEDKNYGIKYHFIQGCMTTNGKNGGVRYINGGYDTEIYGYNRVNDGQDMQFLPEHPDLSYDDEDAYIEYGNCSPILSYKTVKFSLNDSPYEIYKMVYVGRYGETNETYSKFVKSDIKKEGDGVKVIINNKYPIVDGEIAGTEAVIFEKNSGEDTSSPALQTLTFKNKDGKITDRFDTKEGAKIIVIGGDYISHVLTNVFKMPGYFTCNDANVSLAYSMANEDNWNDLNVVVIPEKYQWPGFGNFYEASLENENIFDGWYDVKVTIEDAAGNYQTQVLRKAFKMENVTDGVMDITEKSTDIIFNGNVAVATGAVEINLFNLAGEKVASTNGEELNVNNVINGVYVVEAVMNDGSKINKKVIVK